MLRVVEEPADVRVIETADHRAVRVAIAIGEAMMVDVVAGPPQRALLHGGGSDERPDEPGDAIHLKCAVREVAMKCEGEADSANEVGGGE